MAKTFDQWFMGALRDIGHESDVFFNQTLPKVGKDITGAISTVYKDTSGIVKDVVHLPTNVLSSGKDVIQQVGSSSSQIISSVGTSGSQILNSNLFNPMTLIGLGLIAGYIVMKK